MFAAMSIIQITIQSWLLQHQWLSLQIIFITILYTWHNFLCLKYIASKLKLFQCVHCQSLPYIEEISLQYLGNFLIENALFDDPMDWNFECSHLEILVAGSRMDHLGSPSYTLGKFCWIQRDTRTLHLELGFFSRNV